MFGFSKKNIVIKESLKYIIQIENLKLYSEINLKLLHH